MCYLIEINLLTYVNKPNKKAAPIA